MQGLNLRRVSPSLGLANRRNYHSANLPFGGLATVRATLSPPFPWESNPGFDDPLVPPAGFAPATTWFEAKHSVY